MSRGVGYLHTHLKRAAIVSAVVLFMVAVLLTRSSWNGDITESAAAPLAEAQGSSTSHMLPWRIEGDLLLFVFLTGGAVAGFVAGYQWRKLFARDGANSEAGADGKGSR